MSTLLSRRDFLRAGLAAAACTGLGLPGPVRDAHAADSFGLTQPFFANLMLNGGPDMRHLLMPPMSSQSASYGQRFWRARVRSQGIDDTLSAMDTRGQQDYLPVSDGTTHFGILARCGWLYDMWEAGKVAFVCGVLVDSSRDHELAQRSMNMGSRSSSKVSYGNGWGGRLAEVADCNVLALTNSPRRFSFGPDPADLANPDKVDMRRVIPMSDTREFGLPEADADPDWFHDYLMRGLRHYYGERRKTIPKASVYRQLFDNERKLRELGGVVDARLAQAPATPGLDALFNDGSVGYELALVARNLYDALFMHDVLDTRIASLEYGANWDTHDAQRAEIEPNLANLFGRDGALAALYAALPTDARAQLTLLIGGEFGRQLADNGGRGTDHGEGTVMIVIGEQVRGGVYGTMFPEEELDRLHEPGADIHGVNGIEHLFGAICDWVQPGAGNVVFPRRASAPLEAGVDLGGIFA
ncbi:MAG: DUF1501 domain-containing protein [Gammaproteobacteria bacterium]|nr:DUF1501 domain-containing protein [Gammaproteobacteria bacterium]